MPTQAQGGGRRHSSNPYLKPRHEEGKGQQLLQSDKIKDGKI